MDARDFLQPRYSGWHCQLNPINSKTVPMIPEQSRSLRLCSTTQQEQRLTNPQIVGARHNDYIL
ncbi:hypothetical protein [Chroococcidiopsis sp. SAG 2025]|uniref:hypothetical protein n=1 Tax=Chroococcidiopsis sp. SAG 2025 TaxID=171389 RepID=UPI002936EAA9|nr:hypothetical protein [Chroococcidiopsis sp. SAG 2025]